MEKTISLKIFAKVNLSLNILGKQGDMHILDMILASVDIHDAITISIDGGAYTDVSIDERAIDPSCNSVTKALDAVRRRVGSFGARAIVNKNIPLLGGMGGSSADAAGTILALDRLLGLQKQGFDLNEIALECGSDTAYMLEGGLKRVGGTGNLVQSLQACEPLNLLISLPSLGCSSGAAYQEFDKMYPSCRHLPADNDQLVAALAQNNILGAAKQFKNALYEPAARLCPEIRQVFGFLSAQKPLATFMTGSGSAVVGVFDTKKAATMAAEILNNSGIKTLQTTTRNSGYQFADQAKAFL